MEAVKRAPGFVGKCRAASGFLFCTVYTTRSQALNPRSLLLSLVVVALAARSNNNIHCLRT